MTNQKFYNSKLYSVILSCAIVFNFTSCDWLFNTDTTDDNLLELSLSHAIVRVMPSAEVSLFWNEITVENFKEYQIERKTITDTAWTRVTNLTDPFQLSYIDTIWDDEDLIYRVGIADIDDNILWAVASISIPKTTAVLVPDEFKTIQPAFVSKLLDDGDVILVDEGSYQENLNLSGKDVLIKSKKGFKSTILMPEDKGDSLNIKSVVSISSGKIVGFTIGHGETFFDSKGGGLSVTQNGVVQNCLIIWNESSGLGGGIYLDDNGKLYNNIIYQNRAISGSGIYISSAHGEIINNTIIENDVMIEGNCTGLLLRNNIIYNSHPGISFFDQASQTGVTIDYSLLDTYIEISSNNIVADPEFIDYVDFKLFPTSPCVDAGHPGDQYLDIDGSRNDMGAYGGPRSE
jgi:hypothetical protein